MYIFIWEIILWSKRQIKVIGVRLMEGIDVQ